MVGITSIEVKESLEDLAVQLQAAKTLKAKERLQVLYWLKQENPPSILTIAKAIGKHRNTLQTWLMLYREGRVEAMLEVKQSLLWSPGDSAVGRSRLSEAVTRPRTWICELWSNPAVVD